MINITQAYYSAVNARTERDLSPSALKYIAVGKFRSTYAKFIDIECRKKTYTNVDKHLRDEHQVRASTGGLT